MALQSRKSDRAPFVRAAALPLVHLGPARRSMARSADRELPDEEAGDDEWCGDHDEKAGKLAVEVEDG